MGGGWVSDWRVALILAHETGLGRDVLQPRGWRFGPRLLLSVRRSALEQGADTRVFLGTSEQPIAPDAEDGLYAEVKCHISYIE